jgi:putative membrane protein
VARSRSLNFRHTRPHRVGSPADPRFSLANERTFLAWNRTALALIAGGLAASQLLRIGSNGERLVVGLPLIALGSALVIAARARWYSTELAMRLRTAVTRARLAPALLGAGSGLIAVLSIIVLAVQ